MNNDHWIDTKLKQEEMNFLNEAIIFEEQRNNNEDWKENAAGNISRCNLIDKDNWFYETVLKQLTERMFYRDWDAYYKYHVEKEEPLPKFKLGELWVNYQKKHEYAALHNHECLYSFVIFVKIPTHYEEQHVPPKKLKSHLSIQSFSSSFQFVWSKVGKCERRTFQLSPDYEGRMLFFPAWLLHQVYPFYECEEERITISGNVVVKDCNELKDAPQFGYGYEEKKELLEIYKNVIKITEEELKQMKKVVVED
tara:strand:+ start:61 stop:816 length:756 start_codon:yes stop_codon:yes gene_type:complete